MDFLPSTQIMLLSGYLLLQVILACNSRISFVYMRKLVMRGSNSSSVGLGCNPALVIVHITVKVLNTALIADP